MSAGIELNNKKTIRSWAFFDWANSAYALVVSTAVFPPYFTSVTPDNINILGKLIPNTAVMSYAVSLAFLLVAFMSPILSSIADNYNKRKMFLKFFTILGSLACMSMFWFDSDHIWIGIIGFIVATVGYGGGVVFYNSYLPLIVTEDRYDSVSAKGFAYGYVGSVLLLLFILFMIQKPDVFGITSASLPARLGFLLVGFWWIIFGFYSFINLPKDSDMKIKSDVFSTGFNEIKTVFNQAKKHTKIRGFLLSYFLYIGAVNTVIYLATPFAEKELNFETSEMIILVLIIQFVGIAGAYFFAWLSNATSNKLSIISMLIIWLGICVGAYFITGKTIFYVLAGMVGLVMGGIQSLSRSTYSKMIDGFKEEITSYFSFYDVLTRLAIVAGTFIFGFVEMMTGSIRNSVLALAVLFLFSIIMMARLDMKEDAS